jgi:hypothetical protein
MIKMTILICALTQFSALPSVAQRSVPEYLDRISEVAQKAVETEMPGWKHRRGEPIKGSGDVLVESYSSGDTTIKLSVIPYASEEEAAGRMRSFKGHDAEKLSDLGDEGHAWEYRRSKFAFKKHKLNIFVSIAAEDMTDKEKIAKQFAKVVADAVKDLDK